MAEESVNLPVTPEKNEANSVDMAKKSAGNSEFLNEERAMLVKYNRVSLDFAVDSARKNSTENANSSQNTIPNYLRASTGSCHDFCKYGRKHALEEKVRTPIRSRISKTPPVELNPVAPSVSKAEDKEKVVMHLTSLKTKKHSPDLKTSATKVYSSDANQSLATRTTVPRQTPVSGKNIGLTKHKPSSSKKKTFSTDPPEIIKREVVFPSQKADDPSSEIPPEEDQVLPNHELSSSEKKNFSTDPPEIVKREVVLSSQKAEVPLEQCTSADSEVLKREKKTADLMKKISSLRSKLAKVNMSSSSETSYAIDGKGKRNRPVPTDRKAPPKAPEQKSMASSPAPLPFKLPLSKTMSNKERTSRSPKLVSTLMDRNRTLRIKTKTSNTEKASDRTLSNQENADWKTKYTGKATCTSISDNNKLVKSGKAQPLTQNLNKNLMKNRVVVSDNKIRSPVKLTFRSGKVMDIQTETIQPRRLKFRKVRILGAQDSEGEMRRGYKNIRGTDTAVDAILSSEKVVLKHQDVQGKKDAQGLLNNVIEETASKLAESRKSKVKALVGAFETVISLQDRKPPSQCQLSEE